MSKQGVDLKTKGGAEVIDIDKLHPGDPDYGAKYLAALQQVNRQQDVTLAKLTAIVERSNAVNSECIRQRDAAQSEVARLTLLINTPRTDDYFEAVRIEAAHQIERWGVQHDAGKRPEDWVTLLVYLLGKAAKAHFDGDRDKLLHHVITVAAVALNWHRNVTGENTAMRPGVGP